ncbi:MAG: hypothetical protein KF836_12580 [Fimbriimonadaceae bacterium]|nr:hypothetical protein [Fimbriimonadaceae bacterium]
MLTAITFAALLAPPPVYMSRATYPAGSTKEDPTAIGGFGTSNLLPTKNNSKTPKEFLTLAVVQGAVNVTISNLDQPDLWLPAADSNLRAWLEVQDGDTWKPAQFQYWASCGNSYHKVFLEQGFHHQYKVEIPVGDWKTNMRFALMTMDSKPKYSKPISVSTAKTIMQLDPEKATEYKVDTRWTIPTLLPKDM